MLDRELANRFDVVWVENDQTWNPSDVQKRAIDKLHAEQPNTRRIRKRTFVVLAAAIIAVMGTFSFASERDWDIQFAELIGTENVMADLPGGYKEISESQTVDGITLTVSKSIGDQNSQWIQVDTNLPFVGENEAWEIFESLRAEPVEPQPHGMMVLPFDAEGQLAFLVEILDAEKINRAEMKLEANLQDGGEFYITWKNYYAENTTVSHPMKVITVESNAGKYPVLIYETAVSPVSVKVKGWTWPNFRVLREDEYNRAIHIEAVTLRTGEVITIADAVLPNISGTSSTGKLDCYVPLASGYSDETRRVDGSEIVSITISGEEIRL